MKTNLSVRLGAREQQGAEAEDMLALHSGFPAGLSVTLPPASDQNFAGCVAACDTHHPATRVRRGAAQVKPSDRRAIIRLPRHGPEAKQLVQRHGPMKDVAPGQGERSLQVQRGQDLPGDTDARKFGAYSVSRSKQRSAKGSRNWSQVASRRL